MFSILLDDSSLIQKLKFDFVICRLEGTFGTEFTEWMDNHAKAFSVLNPDIRDPRFLDLAVAEKIHFHFAFFKTIHLAF